MVNPIQRLSWATQQDGYVHLQYPTHSGSATQTIGFLRKRSKDAQHLGLVGNDFLQPINVKLLSNPNSERVASAISDTADTEWTYERRAIFKNYPVPKSRTNQLSTFQAQPENIYNNVYDG